MQPDIQQVVSAVVQEMQATTRTVSLEQALWLAEKVKAKAREMGLPVVIAVSDRAAHPVLVESMDDAYIASYDVALNKSFTVVSLKMPTLTLKQLAQPGGSLYGIQFTNQGKLVIFGGGEPLCDLAGHVVGGLGISGGSEEQDAALAAYGKQVFEQQFYQKG